MNLKFLPIGTVCLVENVSRKQMIIGYSKSGYDYVAVEYPKGFDSDNKLSYFNHSQVYELYSLGYKNEESRIFNGTLTSVQNEQSEEDDDIVPMSEVKVEKIEEQDMSISVEDIPTISNVIKFDENGVVISDGTEEVKEEKNTMLTSPIKFDENGVVIADGNEEIAETKTDSPIPTIQFDKNGVVISDGTVEINEKPKQEHSEIKFDENGIVVEDGTSIKETNDAPVLKIDENGVVESNEEFPSIDDAATVDVSDVVKQIEETITEVETSEESSEGSGEVSEPPKKEKRGLFHFGRK